MPPLNATTTNTTSNALQVICAWPVSGQYGPGTRILYYVLVAACVFARNAMWLRNACLAAALLVPAIAAIHGIVLAAVHNPAAVDMDIYGAFQLCSIGILAAPVTAKVSRTYFYDPGRNTIFLWTGLVLAGLLSLTVEFMRIATVNCVQDGYGNPVSSNPLAFPYNSNPTCGLTCLPNNPTSPLRGGSQNNIYVIPAPDSLTFGAATLLAAACCIPILEINWKSRFGNQDATREANELIEGTNGATAERMKGVNNYVRRFLSVVEVPVFGGAVLAILIVGEINLWSEQVYYQTEPIGSVGQWSPIVATVLAVLGSFSLLLAADSDDTKDYASSDAPMHPSNCNCAMQAVNSGQSITSARSSAANAGANDEETRIELVPTTTRSTFKHEHHDAGNRRKVAKALSKLGDRFGTAAPGLYDDSEFKHGKAVDFPEIPGEENRNSALPQIRERYNADRAAEGDATPGLSRQLSRASSLNSSFASRLSMEGDSKTPRASSPSRQTPHSPPSPPHNATRIPRSSTLPSGRASFELQNPPSAPPAGPNGERLRKRRDTLEVPSPVQRSPTRSSLSDDHTTSISTIVGRENSPSIVITPDCDTFPAQASPNMPPSSPT